MWIVFGHKSQLTWVPNGKKIDRRCTSCGETATFYEKQATKTFRLYFTDVFDYQRHRVMACGCCGAYYATDELGAPTNPLLDDLTEAASKAEDYAKRAASATGDYLERANDAFSSLFSGGRPRRSPPPSDTPTPPLPDKDEGGDIDIGPDYRGPARSRTSEARSAGAGRVDDDMEARFRELEENARKGE